MSSTEPAAPAASTATEKKEELGPEIPGRRAFWMGLASFGSLTGGIYALAKATHVADPAAAAFWAAIVILVLNCVIFAALGRAKMRQFLIVTMWGMGIGVILAIAGLAFTMWESNEDWKLEQAKQADAVLATAFDQQAAIEARAKYLGTDVALAVEATQPDPTDATAKAARAATIAKIAKDKHEADVDRYTIWDGLECEWKVGLIHKIGVILKLMLVVVVVCGVLWFAFVVATTWNDEKTSVFHKFWVGGGKWGIMTTASLIVGTAVVTGTSTRAQCRAPAIAAQVVIEEAAPAPTVTEESGSKPRKKSKSSAKPTGGQPAPVIEDRPVLTTVASVAPSTNAGCTRRKVGVIAGGQAIYACIPN